MEEIWCIERIAPRCPQNSVGGPCGPRDVRLRLSGTWGVPHGI